MYILFLPGNKQKFFTTFPYSFFVTDFSNYDRNVFLVKLDRMIDRGALLSRYSRASELDIRDVYRKEFSGNEKKGEDFYRRVFVEYGDESIAELVTAQVAVQNVSNIASKIMEELRVGLSFLEKSSRYVRYDRKSSGRYPFMEAETVGITGQNAADYEQYCNDLFDFYSRNYEVAQNFFKRKYPLDSILFSDEHSAMKISDAGEMERKTMEKSYNSAVRARALDDLRFLLPGSTLTNIGISGNGRSFIHLIQKLQSTGLPEAVKLASELYSELSTELPELLKSAVSDHGKELMRYMSGLANFSAQPDLEATAQPKTVTLLESDDRRKALIRVVSIYEFSCGYGDLQTLMLSNGEMQDHMLGEKIRRLADMRENRRHKLHRAFETVWYLFQINTNYGAFRDLQRHRFISIVRKPLTALYGYDTPDLFQDSAEFHELMQKGKELWKAIVKKDGPMVAQYSVPYAYRYPVSAYLNLRELAFFCELRSTPQAHYDLRRIASDMYDAVKAVHPELSSMLKFVDTSDYALGRLKSEHMKERKLRDIKENVE
jgi:thymidylate synthase ThyX